MKIKCISLDIDGVVNNYPLQLFKYATKHLGKPVTSMSELRSELDLNGISYIDFKYEYRRKYECIEGSECNDLITGEFKKFYEALTLSTDYKIVFRTSRPVERYPNQLINTYKWLLSQGVECLEVVPKNRATFEFYRPSLHIDDEITALSKHLEYCDSKLLLCYEGNQAVTTSHGFKKIRELSEVCRILMT